MALTRKRICITGGAGFIGSYLVQRLLDDNDVVVYDNLHRNAIQFAHVDGHPHLHFVKGDVMDYDATRRAMDGCQIVIHCAAIAGVYSVDRNAVTTMEVNLLGTHQVVKAALDVGVERFVEFSTSEVYGPFIHKGKEDDLTTIGPIGESRWVYAASKLASEHLSYAHYKEDGLPLSIVRPFNVYGPRQVGDGAIRGMILQALRNAPITLYNDGTQIRAWCYVEDFVDGVLRCAERPEAIGHAFNLGNPQGTITNFELANMIIRLTKSKSDIVFKPHPGPEVDLRVPSIDKAATMLGFKPTVSLEAGISRTIPWYAEHLSHCGSDRRHAALRLNARAHYRRVRIHRPQRAAAGAARLADRRRVPQHDRARRDFVARRGLTHVRAVQCDLTSPADVAALAREAGSVDACLYLAANGDPAASSERPALGSAAQHARAGHVPRAHDCRSLRLRVVRGRLRRPAGVRSRRRHPVAPRLPYAISKLASEHYLRAFAERRRTVGSFVNVRFFGAYGPYEPGAKDHDALDARHDGRPARVHASRQRRQPHRLHVRRRCGGRIPDADGRFGLQRDGRFRVRRAGQRQRRRADDGPGAGRGRHAAARGTH